MIGQTISHYRIVEKLGEGGMGVVYKAEDTNLDRTVALKFLAGHLLESEEHKQRFLREARATASLDHPNICMVHEVGEADGRVFLAMGYIDGPEVRAKIKERPLKLDEALDIAIQAAAGLQAAHQKGIIHRDIKSANMMLTSTGQVKIMDFGLAQLSGGTRLTKTNTILGTPAYMSPEQAQRLPTDRRSDIWSLAVVLYEMVTGRLPFEGEREQAVLYAIAKEEPEPITALRAGVPTELDRIVGKALSKNPADRYQHVDDMLVDLRALRASLDAARTSPSQSRARTGTKAVWAAAAMALLAVLALVLNSTWRSVPSEPLRVEYTQLTNLADSAVAPALSPDGRMVAFIRGESTFVGAGNVYVKFLPDGEPVQLTRDDSPKMGPLTFSPDGSRIAYTVGVHDTWIVPVLGGEPSRMLVNASGLTWINTAGGPRRILFSKLTGEGLHMGIFTATESRAEERMVYLPADINGMAHRSALSPDQKWVLLAEMDLGGWLPCRLVPFDGSSPGERVGPSPAQCTDVAWSPDGQWMYFSADTGNGFRIWRQHFPGGLPEQVTSGATEEQGLTFDPDGSSFLTSVGAGQSTLWVHDSRGDQQVTSEGYAYLPSFSPDGKKLYYLVRSRASRHFVSGELWVAHLETGRRERLLPDFLIQHYDVAPDGNRVVFVRTDEAGRFPVWLATLDGRSPPRLLASLDSVRCLFGANGGVFFVGGEEESMFLHRIQEDGTALRKVVPDPVNFLYDVSPDGKWLAVWMSVSGDVALYPVEGGSPVTICSGCGTAGGEQRGVTPPLVTWAPDQRVVYLHGFRGQTYAVPLRPGEILPPLPESGLASMTDFAGLPGARLLPEPRAFAGPAPSLYAFPRIAAQRNIYRISVP